jgi:hypothetical protein
VAQQPGIRKPTYKYLDLSRRSDVLHVDFHWAGSAPGVSHAKKVRDCYGESLSALQSAHERGLAWVVFMQGSSTSGRSKDSCRSVIRELLQSPAATPYVDRARCFSNSSITAVAIRQGRT